MNKRCLLLLALVNAVVMPCSLRAEPPETLIRDAARELGAKEAPLVLGVPEDYVQTLTQEKSKLTDAKFQSFRHQFGRLENGLPTYQVQKKVWFVLIPIDQLFRQPKVAIKAVAIPPKVPPMSVDHTKEQTPVRNQGERGTCTAFAACAELEAIIKREKKKDAPLCTNLAYYWFMEEEGSTPCADTGIQTFRAAEYLKKHLVCEDSVWPYVETDPFVLRKNGMCVLIDKPSGKVRKTDGWGIEEAIILPAGKTVKPEGKLNIKDTLTLEKFLAEGHDIVFGTVFAWETADAMGIIDVQLGPAGQPIFGAGGHAMLIVGYDKSGAKPYFIVKNSWGKDYGGQKGYLRISYDYIRTYAKYGYVTTKHQTGKVEMPAEKRP